MLYFETLTEKRLRVIQIWIDSMPKVEGVSDDNHEKEPNSIKSKNIGLLFLFKKSRKKIWEGVKSHVKRR